MGQTLSEPVVDKNSDRGQDEYVAYGVSAMQGWRISMEDAHAAVLNLLPETDGAAPVGDPPPQDRLSFFGVYDGHGGDKVALFAGQNVHRIIAKQDAFQKKDYEQALKDGFLATDRAILNDPKYEEEVSGCTASVALISSDKVYVANAGDSRTVLGIKGRAKPLSFDHKPQNEGEKARICAAGGFVDFGRVNGNLALSRALGDFEFKKGAELSPEQQIVTAFPDVVTHEITGDDEFVVIACDGIWDCQSSQAVVEFVRRGIVAGQELDKISENMMDNCLAANSETGGVGCDNMTMVVIALLRGRTLEQWYQEVADRVAKDDGPCAPAEFGKLLSFHSATAPVSRFAAAAASSRRPGKASWLTRGAPRTAELRGPGVRRPYEDHDDDFEDMDQRTRALGGRSGRIILLGDGSNEGATGAGAGAAADGEDHDMLDDSDDGHELEAQAGHDLSGAFEDDDGKTRHEREGTPGPEAVSSEPASTLAGAAARSDNSATSHDSEDTVVDPPERPSGAGSAVGPHGERNPDS